MGIIFQVGIHIPTQYWLSTEMSIIMASEYNVILYILYESYLMHVIALQLNYFNYKIACKVLNFKPSFFICKSSNIFL